MILTSTLSTRLTDADARRYAALLERGGRWRVSVFPIGYGRANVELRPLPGHPWCATEVLRTVDEAEAWLAREGQA